MMRSLRSLLPRHLPGSLCCLLLIGLLAACGASRTTGTGGNGSPTSSGTQASGQLPAGKTPTGNAGDTAGATLPMPATQTACPTPGTARAAVLAHLALGNHQNLVYTVNQYQNHQPLSGTLKRYDVATGNRNVIVTLSGVTINEAQVSADGQWVLFTAYTPTQTRLQLVRMDGKGLQTLYCSASVQEEQWSTDQKHIVFAELTHTQMFVRLLTPSTGALQTDLSLPNQPGQSVAVHTWLDNSHVYLSNTQVDQPSNVIYVLDITRGANQNLNNLTRLSLQTFGDFDSSYDGTQLFVDYGQCNQGGCNPPGKITAQPATGGTESTIINSSQYDVLNVRAVASDTLLVLIRNDQPLGNPDRSHNGLWKMHTNGSGLTRLTTDAPNQSSWMNSSSQFPWSNLSRDGHMYALQLITTHGPGQNPTSALAFGPINGGAPVTFAWMSDGTNLNVVGWTTM